MSNDNPDHINTLLVKKAFFGAGFSFFVGSLFFGFLMRQWGVSFHNFLKCFFRAQYQNFNVLSLGFVDGINLCFIILIFVAVITACAFFALLILNRGKSFLGNNARIAFFVSVWTVSFGVVAFQTWAHFSEYSKYLKHYRSFEEIQTLIPIDKFVVRWKALLPGKHRIKFITDLDLNRDPYMFWQRYISFKMFPADIREIGLAPHDSIIAFRKKNAADFVPRNFKIVWQPDDENLVAIKE